MQQFTKDQQLLIDLKQGHPEAVQCWYRKYMRPLRRFITQKVVNVSDVDELAQDTFMSCLKHLPLFRGESSIWTWMVRIAQHEVADYYRRKYAKKVVQTLSVSEIDDLPEIESSVEISYKVKSVLKKMSATSRELLQKKYIDKQHVKAIAVELGRSVKSIESLLFRARIEFRELYAQEGD
jgi:RNA polymerase sigma-70 factor, ECF subfamily